MWPSIHRIDAIKLFRRMCETKFKRAGEYDIGDEVRGWRNMFAHLTHINGVSHIVVGTNGEDMSLSHGHHGESNVTVVTYPPIS